MSTPLMALSYSDDLRISSNDPDTPVLVLAVNATGVASTALDRPSSSVAFDFASGTTGMAPDLWVGESTWDVEGVTVPIFISDASSIAAAELELEFDPEQLRFDEVAPVALGELVPDGFELQVNERERGRVIATINPSDESTVPTVFNGPGQWLTLRFIPLTATTGSGVRLVRAECFDDQGRRVAARVVSKAPGL